MRFDGRIENSPLITINILNIFSDASELCPNKFHNAQTILQDDFSNFSQKFISNDFELDELRLKVFLVSNSQENKNNLTEHIP